MQQFTSAEIQRVDEAVAAAETVTSAEIVPVIARSSGRYDRAEDAFGACCGVALLLFVEFFLHPALEPPIDWRELSLWPILTKLLFLTLGTVIGIVLSSHLPAVRRFFVPRRELTAEVQARAKQVFFDQRVHHTTGRWGILLYLSLFERRAVVLADDRIVEELGDSTIERWCMHLTEQVGAGDPIHALERVIAEIASELAIVCPATPDQKNERPDAMILIGDIVDETSMTEVQSSAPAG